MFDAAALVVSRNRWCSTSLRKDYAAPEEKIVLARNSMRAPPASGWGRRAVCPHVLENYDPDEAYGGLLDRLVALGAKA